MEVTGLPCNAVSGTTPCPACLSLAYIFLQVSPLLSIMPLSDKEQGASEVLQGWMEHPPAVGQSPQPQGGGRKVIQLPRRMTRVPTYPWPSPLTWDPTLVKGCPGNLWYLQCWALREGTSNNHDVFHPALKQRHGLDNLPRSQPATPGYAFSSFESSGSEGKQSFLSDLPGRCGRVRYQNFLSLSPVP